MPHRHWYPCTHTHTRTHTCTHTRTHARTHTHTKINAGTHAHKPMHGGCRHIPSPSARGIPMPRMAPKADPDSTMEEADLMRGGGVASAPAGAGVGATSAAWAPTSRLGSGGCSQKMPSALQM